jgi:hypothetical protein
MNFRLVDSDWEKAFRAAARADGSSLRIVSPFIKKKAAERLLEWSGARDIQVITRFNLHDFAEGVSDITALRLLLERGARIRGIRNLHAKLYLFGQSNVIVTSANLTDAAIRRNHEIGTVGGDPAMMDEARRYFERLWKRGGGDLAPCRLDGWESRVAHHRAFAAHLAMPERPGEVSTLRDEGHDAGLRDEAAGPPAWAADAEQGFVKFFGDNLHLAEHTKPVLEEVSESGSHWACTYPKIRRPRQVKDGALMFMARRARNPADILVYGHAVGMRHVGERDDATPADLLRRPWKENWPRYVRVHHAEFIAGTLGNGVSLHGMMDELGAAAFATTERNAFSGEGNTNPRRAYIRQPHVELSQHGIEWLSTEMERSFARHGTIPAAELARLDWPEPSPSF